MRYEFSIIASGIGFDDFEGRLHETGCDDATACFQQGRIIVDFAREAETAEAAVSSAMQNVFAAGATVAHVSLG
jgi:uncharacterized membrane protein